jgi:hypothetical protein
MSENIFTVWLLGQQEESDGKKVTAYDAQMAAIKFAERCLGEDGSDLGGDTVFVKSPDGKVTKFDIISQMVPEFYAEESLLDDEDEDG